MKAAHYSPKQKAWIEANKKQFYTMARKYIDAQIAKPKTPITKNEELGLSKFEVMNKRRSALLSKLTKSELEFYSLMDIVNIKYEKQYPIRLEQFLFFADVYFPHLSLVIEIDGKYHDSKEQKKKDDFRTMILEKHGYNVCRFKNGQVHDRIFIFETLCKYGLTINACDFI